ncbi:MAG: pyroglutamyl-peptidase I [Candidatus Bathyarchaeota archaeon]|nr:MAG: pyroglutamyl-peptidase I [Candidatus Bathyarchaeota archaeon]
MTQMSRVIALTGFEAFANFKVNPSWEAVRTFDGKNFSSCEVKSFKIPLVFEKIKPSIAEIIKTQRPAAVVGLGQSYRPLISLEKIAINLADLTGSTVLYNCGTRPRDKILEPNAPAAYFTRLPLLGILTRLGQIDIPAEISYTAGTFGCNQLFFHMMHELHCERSKTLAGFIHVPCLPEQAAQLQRAGKPRVPSMNLKMTIQALDVAIKATVDNLEETNL